MAVKNRLGRLDLAAQGAQHQINHRTPGIDKIGMGEFLERDNDISIRNALLRQVAMRIITGADNNIRAGNVANARNQVTFAIQISLRHHGPVQP